MKLASYRVRGRDSFGVVVGDGVVDLKLRLGAGYDSVLELLCAGATGTPVKLKRADAPAWLKPGDTVEVACPEIGVLRNTVVAEQ